MLICKQGYFHKENDINNHDFGSTVGRFSIVTDGCSGGEAPEVGVKLFHYLMADQLRLGILDTIPAKVAEVFKEMSCIMHRPEMFGNFCLFTIMIMEERNSEYQVWWQGDGNIITITHDNVLEFHAIEKNLADDLGDAPPYYAYNYIPQEFLSVKWKDPGIATEIFPKDKYCKVGIASDGIDWIRMTDYESLKNKKNKIDPHPLRVQMKEEFESLILNGRGGKIEQLIRRANRDLDLSDKWKDDITIIM